MSTKTAPIRFVRPLRTAELTLREGLNTEADRNAVNDSTDNRKIPELTETENQRDAKSAILITQETASLLSKLEQQVRNQAVHQANQQTQLQELAVQLGMEIASAVIRHEVAHYDTRIRQLLNNLINQHEPPIPIVVYVNKEDLELLRVSFQEAPSLDSMLQLKLDDSLERGNARFESSEQRLIADWRHQLADIQLQLLEYLNDARLERQSP